MKMKPDCGSEMMCFTFTKNGKWMAEAWATVASVEATFPKARITVNPDAGSATCEVTK